MTNFTWRNHWRYVTEVSKDVEHGLKYITFYVKKYIATLAMCYNPSLVRGKPLGACAFVKLVYWTAKWQPSCLCLIVLLTVTPTIWQPKINFSVLWIFNQLQNIYPIANDIQQETDLFYYLWHMAQGSYPNCYLSFCSQIMMFLNPQHWWDFKEFVNLGAALWTFWNG